MSDSKGQILSIKIPLYCKKKSDYACVCGAINHYRAVARRIIAELATFEVARQHMGETPEGFLQPRPSHEEEKLYSDLHKRLTTLAATKKFTEENGVPKLALVDAWISQASKMILNTWKSHSHFMELRALFNTYKSNAIEKRIIELAPHWRSDLVQECRAFIESRWTAKDAETKLPFNMMLYEFKRKLHQFDGAAFPIKWCASTLGNIKFIDDHNLELTWMMSNQGSKFIEFDVNKMDPMSWRIYKTIQLKRLLPGGAYLILNRKGELYLKLGYYVDSHSPELEGFKKYRTLEVAFDMETPEAFMKFSVADRVSPEEPPKRLLDELRGYSLSSLACTARLDRLTALSEARDAQRRACGSRRFGYRAELERCTKRLNKVTKCREAIVRAWANHFANRVSEIAKQWKCARILVMDVPSLMLFKRSFQWSQFRDALKYKAKILGVTLTFEESPGVPGSDQK